MPWHTGGAHGESPRKFLWYAGLGMSLWMPACWQVPSILHHKTLGIFPEVGGKDWFHAQTLGNSALTLGNSCPNLRELSSKCLEIWNKKLPNKSTATTYLFWRWHFQVFHRFFLVWKQKRCFPCGGRAKVLLDVSLFELEPLSTAATTSSLQFRCGRRWANEFHVSKESMVELPRKPHVVVLYASPVKNTHRIHGCRTVYFTYMKAIHVSPTCTDQIHRSSHGWIRFMGKNNLLRMGILAYQPFTLINSCFWFPE